MLSFFSRKQKKSAVVGKKPVVEVKKPIVEVKRSIVEVSKTPEAPKPVVEAPKLVEVPKPVTEAPKPVEVPKPAVEETSEKMAALRTLPQRLFPGTDGLGVPEPRRHVKSQSAFVSYPLRYSSTLESK